MRPTFKRCKIDLNAKKNLPGVKNTVTDGTLNFSYYKLKIEAKDKIYQDKID